MLARAARGQGLRSIAAASGVPEDTIRGRLRRFRSSAGRVRERFTRLAGVLAVDPVPLDPAGSVAGDAVVAVVAAAATPRPVPEHRGGARSDGHGGAAWSEPGHRRRPQAGSTSVAAGATAVALSGDRDQNAALGRRDLHQDRADIACVQVGALAEPDAAVPARRLTSPRAQLPALMQLTAGGRV